MCMFAVGEVSHVFGLSASSACNKSSRASQTLLSLATFCFLLRFLVQAARAYVCQRECWRHVAGSSSGCWQGRGRQQQLGRQLRWAAGHSSLGIMHALMHQVLCTVSIGWCVA
jgi:hypothetical protein